ncbi:hypothetical protein ACVWZX_002350 [Deinococcus sp. UYEF24]
MKLFVGVTDGGWFRHLAAQPNLEEVNFWRPSGKDFKALQTGELFLFKLHHPANVIVGGGFFARSLILPVGLAWEAFGQANGASTLAEVKARIGQYRHEPIGQFDNPPIGCILLAEPFFLSQDDWIEVPSDFAKNIVQGKTYNTETEVGQALYDQVADRLRRASGEISSTPAVAAVVQGPRYGTPRPVAPRLGQGTFRALVTEAYNRRCAVTGERTSQCSRRPTSARTATEASMRSGTVCCCGVTCTACMTVAMSRSTQLSTVCWSVGAFGRSLRMAATTTRWKGNESPSRSRASLHPM